MELQQLHSSRQVNAAYHKALKQLSEQLHETWQRIFPSNARWPRETCEAFFEPFAQFGVALYDAYARALLDANPSQEQYFQALNFDLKTLVWNRINPYREKPIKTLHDAIDAAARGELRDEWTVRMEEAWRLFPHPRHNTNDDRVRREFIDLYGYMPELWDRLFTHIHDAISRRVHHWASEHAERAAALERNEGEESKKTIIARLPAEALVRMEADTAAFLADYLPKLERGANKSGPVHDAELLRELVIHQFNLVARECMAVCGSVEEFEAEVHSDIARFVLYGLSQYRWLADPMRKELEAGFALFVMRANPWAEIPEKDRASVWHVGAITGEALTHAALKLRAEAWTRAAGGGFPKADKPGESESSGAESTRTEAGPAVNGAHGNETDRRAAIDAFISKLADAGRKITRKNIWTVAGYTNATEFERFQRGDTRTTQSAAAAFNRVLSMKPENFIGLLDKKSAAK